MRAILDLVTGFLVNLTLALLLMEPASAAPQCDAYDRVTTLLADRYGEALVGQGVAGETALMQLFVHPNGDTWSIVLVLPDGRACLMASGSGWEPVPTTPAGEGI